MKWLLLVLAFSHDGNVSIIKQFTGTEEHCFEKEKEISSLDGTSDDQVKEYVTGCIKESELLILMESLP